MSAGQWLRTAFIYAIQWIFNCEDDRKTPRSCRIAGFVLAVLIILEVLWRLFTGDPTGTRPW